MSTYSKILLGTTNHTFYDTVKNITGPAVPGDGYYNRSDGIHTVQWNVVGLVGKIKIQATLHNDPADIDWFDVSLESTAEYSVDTTGKVSRRTTTSFTYSQPTTGSFVYNFVGNYVWIRANVSEWTDGSVTNILLSH